MTFLKEVRNRSLNIPAWLLVLYSVAVGLSWQLLFNIVYMLITEPEADSCYEPYYPAGDKRLQYVVISVQYVVFPFLFPFTGWIADTKIGREIAIRVGLWCCWIGTVLQTVSYCIQYGTCGLPVNVAKYGISSVAFVFLAVGVAFFLSNILAHGLDQMVYKSNTQIRSFIHWIVWGWFVGESTNFISHISCSIYDSKLMMISGTISSTVVSIAVVCSLCFKHHFICNGVLLNNPYSMVYTILKYAVRHKKPENRSSLTFWESQTPNRIDFGKEKYGGPFVEERVENVKMLGRIVLILLSTFGFYTTYYVTVVNINGSCNNDKEPIPTFHQYLPFMYFNLFNKLILLIVPLLELLIYPLLPKLEYFCLNSLRSFGIAYIAMLLSLLAISTIRLMTASSSSDLTDGLVDHERWTSTTFAYYWIPFSLSGLMDGLSLIFIFEFISSQAPVDMSGMLTGLFWLLRGSFINAGQLVQFRFSEGNCSRKRLCVLWIVLIELLLCVIGFIVYIYAVWKYKKRKKETEYDIHRVVEDTYTRILNDSNRDQEMVYNSGKDYNLLFKQVNN